MKFRIWPQAWWLRVLVVGLLVVVLPYAYSRLASVLYRVSIHEFEEFKVQKDREATQSAERTRNQETAQGFRIASYNIAHGRGLAVSNSTGGERQERTERLDSIAGLLREVDADDVVLNEVDFDASWGPFKSSPPIWNIVASKLELLP